jgi:hypothetical protein
MLSVELQAINGSGNKTISSACAKISGKEIGQS